MFVYTRNKCNKNIIAQLSRRQENQLFCFVQKPWRKPYGLAGGTSSGSEINTNLNMKLIQVVSTTICTLDMSLSQPGFHLSENPLLSS